MMMVALVVVGVMVEVESTVRQKHVAVTQSTATAGMMMMMMVMIMMMMMMMVMIMMAEHVAHAMQPCSSSHSRCGRCWREPIQLKLGVHELPLDAMRRRQKSALN
jgi:hypothetical protein